MSTIKGIMVTLKDEEESNLFMNIEESREDFTDTIDTMLENENITYDEYSKMLDLINTGQFEELLESFGDLISEVFPSLEYQVIYH